MTRYAKDTTVSPARSRAEIEDMVRRFGATGFMSGSSGGVSIVAFEAQNRRVLMRVAEPDWREHVKTPTGKTRDAKQVEAEVGRERRRRWRSLALLVKAKLVAVEDGIETFEDAFMAHIVMPDGLTVGDHVRPRIAHAYETGDMPPLLPGPST